MFLSLDPSGERKYGISDIRIEGAVAAIAMSSLTGGDVVCSRYSGQDVDAALDAIGKEPALARG